MPKLEFEKLDTGTQQARLSRAKIPGGWLLLATSNSGRGPTFYSDRSTRGTETRSRGMVQRLLVLLRVGVKVRCGQ